MTAVYLAIETSTPLGSVAVGNGTGVLAEAVLGINSRHSAALLPAIDFVLANAAVDRQQIGRVIVGGGPGSFTGLRISAATGKAFANALDIELFQYSGLAALAAGTAISDKQVCGMFDARRGEVYAGCYRFPDFARMETVLEPAPRHVDDVLNALDVAATVFVGDGALRNAEVLLNAGAVIAPAHFAVPRASTLLWLNEIASIAGRVNDVAAWEPLYMRDSGAQRMRPR